MLLYKRNCNKLYNRNIKLIIKEWIYNLMFNTELIEHKCHFKYIFNTFNNIFTFNIY